MAIGHYVGMPDTQTEEQQMSEIEADQMAGLNQQRYQDYQKQLAAQALLEGSQDSTTVSPIEDDREGGGDDDEEEGELERVPQEQPKQPASLQIYFLFGCFAFLIDVLIDMIGGFIFLSPVSFALGLCFKVPAYFILTSGGKRETLVAKRVVMMVCAIMGFLPGDNLAAVLISCFIDYKDKIAKKAGKLAELTGRKDIAMAAKVLERGSKVTDKARELDQRDRDRQIQEGGGRWRPPKPRGSGYEKYKELVARNKQDADSKDIKKAA